MIIKTPADNGEKTDKDVERSPGIVGKGIICKFHSLLYQHIKTTHSLADNGEKADEEIEQGTHDMSQRHVVRRRASRVRLVEVETQEQVRVLHPALESA